MGDKKPKRPGPQPDILKVEEEWMEAMKKAIGKKKPAEGWPEAPVKKRKPRRKKA